LLKILYASSTDVLLRDLVRSLGAPGDPARRRSVLLPSRPLVERVNQALAREQGVAMGCELLLPAAFLERVALHLGMDPMHPSWNAEGMFWRILELLPALAQRHPRRLRDASLDLRSRAALAREVADRFDQYLHFRPDLIKAWDAGCSLNEYLGRRPELKAVFKEGFPETVRRDEAWQMDLWRSLCEALDGHAHPAPRLDAMAARAARMPLGDFEPAVEVLSTGPLPFPILKMLKALGGRVEVRLRVLLPANGYLADIQPRWLQWVRNEAADLEAEGNPLVAQMGRQAVESFRGLLDLSEGGQEFEALEEEEAPGASLLARMQSDVRSLCQPDQALRPVDETLPGGLKPLRSLRVHRCYGPRREVETLRDEILRAFKEIEGLRPEDVLILAPDLDLYGPLAEALLAEGAEPRLPLGLAEHRVEQRDPLYKALLSLLSLASGRGSLSEALAFLDLPAVHAALGAEAAQELAGRLKACGLTFGFDAGHRRALGAGDDPTGTWRVGLDRLLAGLLLGAESSAADRDGRPLLPVAGDLGGAGRDLQDGLQWCEDLLGLLLEWQAPATPWVWGGRLERALEGLLRSARTRLDASAGLELARALRQAGEEHACAVPLDAAAVLDHARSLGADERRRVSAVGGRMALGGLKPLRALPCRVLAIVGLSDAAFPRRGQARAWDLLAALPLPGDRDPRKEDRQLFLDSLLAAADRVILTAPVRSQHTDKLEPLSACVDELLRTALDTLGCGPDEREQWGGALVVDQPLQPFSVHAFDGDGGRDHSFDRVALELARRLAAPRAEVPFAAPGCVDPGPEAGQDMDLDGLLAFLKDPAKAFLRARGIAPALEAEDLADDDDEPVDAAVELRRWRLDTEALASAFEGGELFLMERLGADRLLPLGRLGRLRGGSALEQAAGLAAEVRRFAGGRPQTFPAEAVLDDGRRVQGLLQRSAPGSPSIHWGVDSVEGQSRLGRWKAKPRLLLAAWLKACLAAASGDVHASLLAARPKKEGPPLVLRLPLLEPAQARRHLARLLDLRDRGRSVCPAFAPETSYAVARALRDNKDALQAAVEAWSGKAFIDGEGSKPSNALAWRGQDPFSETRFSDWMALAREVWDPLLTWWDAALGAGDGEVELEAEP
jgi:exodeoxyribonuclease V gamma subunit